MFVRDIVGGPNQVRVFDLDGKPMGRLPLPDIAGNSEIEGLANGDVLFDITTYLRPRYYAVWHAATGETGETRLKVTSPVSFSDAEVVREFATSKDGTKVPINIVRKKGTKLDGSNPALLYGYGGYGISETPVFLGAMRQWLEDFSSVRSKLQTIYEKFEADTGNYQAVHSNTVDEANALKNAIAGGLPGF